MKIAVITGASAGIGREFVRAIDQQKDLDEIWVIARRAGPLGGAEGELPAYDSPPRA